MLQRLAEFAGAQATNVGVNAVLHAADDEPYTLREFTADTLFALHHGYGGYARAPLDERARAAVAAELERRGFTPDQLAAWRPNPEGEKA